MPKNITPEFKGMLQGETMSIATCVKITTPAPFNKVLGFTTWDSDIVFGGVTYYAQNAILGSAISSAIGTGVDNMEVSGVLISVYITDVDIYAGVYDRSRLQMFLVNPNDLTMSNMIVINGVLGDFKTSDGKFIVELRSLTQMMSQQIGETILPTCSVARFMDARCKFAGSTDLAGHAITSLGTVTSIEDDTNIHMSGIVTVGGYYTYGTMAFVTGLNTGIEREIKVHGSGTAITTTDLISSPSAPGLLHFNPGPNTTIIFAIPAGTWTSAYIATQEYWNLRSMLNQGTVNLYLELPVGDQYLVGTEGWTGTYQHNATMSALTMTAINTLASGGGGTITGHIYTSNPTLQYLLDVVVESCVLILEGTPATTSDMLQLGEPFPYVVAPGDTANVTAGCDRLITTCDTKYGNKVNFRGFPYVPGTDYILKAGQS